MIAFPSKRWTISFIAAVLTPVYIIFLYRHFITNISVHEYLETNFTSPIQNLAITQQTKTIPAEAEDVKNKKYKCDWPKLNPFDPSIMKAYTEYLEYVPENFDCAIQEFPLIFETDLDSNLIMTRCPFQVGLESCCYKKLTRVEREDTKVKYSDECIKLTNTTTKIPADYEFVAVLCSDINRHLMTTTATTSSSAPTKKAITNISTIRPRVTSNAPSKSSKPTTIAPLTTTKFTPHPSEPDLRIVDILPLLRLKPEVEKRIEEKIGKQKDDDAFSVVILGVDSMSYMNLLRTMPKTNKFLTEDLGAIRMDGFNSIASYTIANLSPALTGYTVEDLYKLCSPEHYSTMDTCPFIWKNFSAQGYRTSYDEDAPDITMFNYRRYGFLEPPTDYYLRPLIHGQYITIGHRDGGNEKLCHGPRPAVEILLNRMHKLAKVMRKRKYFQLIWTSSITHDVVTYPILQDNLFYEHLKSMKEEGLLDNKIVIVMSDHGIRWSSFRKTYYGQLEFRMPFLFFILPVRFREKYPEAVTNLKYNVNRLVSPFDIHKTLLHLLEFDKISTTTNNWSRFYMPGAQIPSATLPIVNSTKQVGISLFNRIPANRTCDSVGIPIDSCICHHMKSLPTNNTLVTVAANKLVETINHKIKNLTHCATLKMANVSESYDISTGFQWGSMESNATNTSQLVRLTVETVPGNAQFEATMSRNDVGDWGVVSDSRINKYGNQSICVLDPVLKSYCYCSA